MILQALNKYYDRLAANPESGVVRFGFSRQKISFRINLNLDGDLQSIETLRREEGSSSVPLTMIVLGESKPPGAGINPCLLWDNSGYLLGWKPDDENPDRTKATFDAFRARHLELESQIDDPDFSAVCRFLESWEPAQASSHPELLEAAGGFGVFRIAGTDHHVHETSRIQSWWSQQIEAEVADDCQMQCLVTGQHGPIARIHEPRIKGVWGAQSAGALLVSYNFDATESYGKSQSFTGPVSKTAAFRYAVALNRLLARGSRQRLQVGDATTVFWTDKPTPAESFLTGIFQPSDIEDIEDEALKKKLGGVLDQIRLGKYPDDLGPAETPFYMLGLSPNAARLSVRFWNVDTLGNIVGHLHQHFADLHITKPPKAPEFPSLWMLLGETAREQKDIPPLLAGSLLRAILTGTAYPHVFYSALLRRIRADRNVNYLRAAAIKACLNRSFRLRGQPAQESISMAFDPNRPEPAFQMGRLFAVLEKVQEDASGGELNATIKDRYFSAASATPGSVFPRLIRLSQHHLAKIDNRGFKVAHEKRIQDICSRLHAFSPHLSMADQGLFAIGYYQQRQDLFTKKTPPTSENENSAVTA